MNGWTDARRKRQAMLIQSWKPWERSSGPKSAEGKAKVARNALKHGARSKGEIVRQRELRVVLRAIRADFFRHR